MTTTSIPGESVQISNDRLKEAAMLLRSLNHKLRLRIIKYIHDRGRVTVKEIHFILKMEQSVASMHLAILRKEGLVITEKQGTFVFYSLNYDRIKHVQSIAKDLV